MTELTYNEAEYLMHCIMVCCGNKQEPFLDESGDEVILTSDQISELFIRIKGARRAAWVG